MRSFSDINPLAAALYFFCVTGIAMFSSYPPVMALSLFGGVLFFIVRNGRSRAKSHLFFFILFMILLIANPLMSHNGVTVLLVMNDNPVTLEALLYGLNSAAMIVGVLYWFRSFTQIMTSDKLLYITGSLSPKLSLIISMALRFVPLFNKQSQKIKSSQTAMGLFKDDNIIDDIRARMRIFSILITWALENGITTADSMSARGYGCTRRSQFRRFRFHKSDVIFLIITAGLFALCCAALSCGSLEFTFYPAIKYSKPDLLGICGISAYSVLVLMPVIIETGVSLKWKYFMSKI